MHTFDIELTAIMADLKTKRFNNICRQEQMSEKIWHLEKRVMKQCAEGNGCGRNIDENQARVEGIKGGAGEHCHHCWILSNTGLRQWAW